MLAECQISGKKIPWSIYKYKNFSANIYRIIKDWITLNEHFINVTGQMFVHYLARTMSER